MIKIKNVWITEIYKKGFNEVIFFNELIENLTLHTNINIGGRIESSIIQPSRLGDYTVREVGLNV